MATPTSTPSMCTVTAGRTRRARTSTARLSDRTNRSQPAGARTTPDAGSTTATPRRTRISAWRGGTSSSREDKERDEDQDNRGGPGCGHAAPPRDGDGRRLPPPDRPRQPRQAAFAHAHAEGLQEGEGLLQDDPEGYRQGGQGRH